MWGKVVLNRGEQIRGYIVFEVKKNSDYKQFRWKTADTIWRLAGDESTDFNYYSKRLLLSWVYLRHKYKGL